MIKDSVTLYKYLRTNRIDSILITKEISKYINSFCLNKLIVALEHRKFCISSVIKR